MIDLKLQIGQSQLIFTGHIYAIVACTTKVISKSCAKLVPSTKCFQDQQHPQIANLKVRPTTCLHQKLYLKFSLNYIIKCCSLLFWKHLTAGIRRIIPVLQSSIIIILFLHHYYKKITAPKKQQFSWVTLCVRLNKAKWINLHWPIWEKTESPKQWSQQITQRSGWIQRVDHKDNQ